MNIRLTSLDGLSKEELAAWSKFQEQNPAFDSPYFRPEFSAAVARIRDNVEVAVLLVRAVRAEHDERRQHGKQVSLVLVFLFAVRSCRSR